ncbi:Fructose-bisphosphate aldolase class 1 [Candidatus Bealeia paramacronuclearis]|uniref:fructose-bisphosphate aldolase n=1 Tax=Candidatus Bealeia paramacronuclearis TaxID=1921001 RepID=A0ABZ2C1V6_9PROT|nr:Fructose-bisphosphate aldolase class 1 [Candidatus Bealeia paramacronuclearis]
MRINQRIKKILSHYESDNPGTKGNLARILMHGKLGGTGRMVILPVDQGFEHGPARSFAINPQAYDPHYHYQMAVDASLSAFAAPLGLLEAGADTFAGAIPTILKINSSNSLTPSGDDANQAVTGSVADALRLGCSAIGFTIYPGSNYTHDMFEELREIAEEAKSCGLAVIVWSYVRGNMSKAGEGGIDTIAYGAHMACLLGAHVIKVKLPSDYLENEAAKKEYLAQKIDISTLTARVRHVVETCFQGRRLVVFSGGDAKDLEGVYDDARAIRDGGGNGSIIGRNAFRRPKNEALMMLDTIIKIYQGKL